VQLQLLAQHVQTQPEIQATIAHAFEDFSMLELLNAHHAVPAVSVAITHKLALNATQDYLESFLVTFAFVQMDFTN
jgi:hypothetical protein